jgi:hypothetical protein
MPTFGFAPCATSGCGGKYRIVSRTNWEKFQTGTPLLGGGFCLDCRKAQREQHLAETRDWAAKCAAQRAHDAHRDTLVEAMIARLRLGEHDVEEICEFVLRKRDRARDEEDYGDLGGEQ